MTKDYGYPSFDLICKASSGDETSIKEILNFYDAYISKLCLRPFYEYYSAAEPPVRCGESHLSGLTEPPVDSYSACEYYSAAEPPVRCGESHLSGLTEPPVDSYSA